MKPHNWSIRCLLLSVWSDCDMNGIFFLRKTDWEHAWGLITWYKALLISFKGNHMLPLWQLQKMTMKWLIPYMFIFLSGWKCCHESSVVKLLSTKKKKKMSICCISRLNLWLNHDDLWNARNARLVTVCHKNDCLRYNFNLWTYTMRNECTFRLVQVSASSSLKIGDSSITCNLTLADFLFAQRSLATALLKMIRFGSKCLWLSLNSVRFIVGLFQ